MISFKVDKYDIITEETNGLKTISLISGKSVTSQLVVLRLINNKNTTEHNPIGAIDWFSVLEELNANRDSRYIPILATKIKTLITGTDGVISFDPTNVQMTVEKRKLHIKGLCFTHKCGSIETINL